MEKLIIPNWDKRNWRLEHVPGDTTVTLSLPKAGAVSDGYHTFDELYDHRVTLYIALCRHIANVERMMRLSGKIEVEKVWRSTLHSDGTFFEGWFILGIGKEAGKQIIYHLPLSRWDETNFAESLERGPEFDGHTPADVLKRLADL